MFTFDVIKCALLHALHWERELLQFDQGDVSSRFNRKNDNVMLEYAVKCRMLCKNDKNTKLMIIMSIQFYCM